jgi:tetratricopeptide (TPR) repeat protein
MVRRLNGRPSLLSMFAVVAALAVAVPAFAQSTAIVKGVVKDDKGQPAENVKITFDLQGGQAKHFETKTNKKGEYTQAGLPPGEYKMTAEKDKLGAFAQFQLRAAQTLGADLALSAAGAAGAAGGGNMTAALKKTFDDGLALSNAGKHDEAIAKFNEAITINPKCNDCYDNIGYSYTQLKQYDKAEEAYKKAIEAKPEDGNAYNGLANLYNAQRKFDDAAKASAKATELMGSGSALQGGNADALFNQGVILWNGGKTAEAKSAFEAAVKANPNMAEAHYQLGMALVSGGDNAGAVSEFETYLKLAPSGPNAATAKSMVDTLKK